MKNKFKALLSMLAVFSVLSVSAACSLLPGSSDSSDSLANSSVEAPADSSTSEKANYTVTFVDYDGTVLSSETYEEGATVTAPAAPTRDGNHIHTYKFVGWDQELSAVTGDVTYTAVYEIGFVEYVVTFLDDEGNEISKTTYHYGDTVKVPSGEKEADEYVYTFTGWDTEVDKTVSGDATYTATYTKELASYTITFMVDGEVVGTDTYSAEDKDITVPEIPAKDHYTAAWEAYELTAGDITVNAIYTPITYTITFMAGEEVVGTVDFNIEDSDKTAPAAPELTGYTAVWGEYSFSTLEDQTVSVTYTPNTYKITFDTNGGKCDVEEQEVTYGAEFTLPTATPAAAYKEFLGWQDQNGNTVEAGVWEIADHITLMAVYSDGAITFDNMSEVPSYMKKADATESLEIVDLDGNKVLKIQAKEDGDSPALVVTLEFLAKYFSDESVDFLAFEAKSVKGNHNNFRRITLRSNGTFAADCYDADLTHANTNGGEKLPTSGIRNDAFKTFYFSRADYNAWVNQGVTEERFIASGQQQKGEIFYVDNIRPVTAAERLAAGYNFDNGGVRVNDFNSNGLEGGRTLLFYTSANGSDWDFNIQCDAATTFTNVGYSADNVTSGIRAVQFTKGAGWFQINLPSAKSSYVNIASSNTGYWAVDVYVPADSDAEMKYQTTTWPGVTLKKGGWSTLYVRKNNSLQIIDTTGGTYLVDNLRVVSEEEYLAGARSFEANVGGLRDDTEGDGNVFYVYMGPDHTANRYSFAVTGGGGAELTNPNYSSEIAHDGTYSLSFTKTNGAMTIQMRADSTTYEALKNGFTFWLYTTVTINGTGTQNLTNGKGEKLNGGEGMFVPANTWVQITITADDIAHAEGDSPCPFFKLNGSTAGTFYLDGFQALPVADAE